MSNVTDDENCGVYCILNTQNGKKYVGSSKHMRRRWTEHIKSLDNGTHRSVHLRSAWAKYGAESFLFYVIETCDPSDLLDIEAGYISEWNTHDAQCGYNAIKDPRQGIRTLRKSSRELSASAQRGKPRHPASSAAIRAYLNDPARVKAATDKREAKLNASGRKHMYTEEYRQKQRASHIGRPRSEECKRNISRAKSRFSASDIAGVLRLRCNGMSITQITSLLECSQRSIYRIVNTNKRYAYIYINELMRAECDLILQQRFKWLGVEYSPTMVWPS